MQWMQAAAALYTLVGERGKAAALFLQAGCIDEARAIIDEGQHPDLQLPLAEALEGKPSCCPSAKDTAESPAFRLIQRLNR